MAGVDFTESFVLTDEQFEAWWSTMPLEDRQEFNFVYGGDDILARFVCALEYLTIQKVKTETADDYFTLAYYIAAVRYQPALDMADPGLRNRAIRAWKSDAVQALHDRVRYRSVRQGSIRLQNKLFELGEQMLEVALQEETPLKEKRYAADVAIRIAALVNTEEQVVRAERTKRGMESARKALAGADNEITERELSALIKAGVAQLGPERIKALMSGE